MSESLIDLIRDRDELREHLALVGQDWAKTKLEYDLLVAQLKIATDALNKIYKEFDCGDRVDSIICQALFKINPPKGDT